MLRIDIISAVPGLLESPLGLSIPKKAIEKGLAEIHLHNLHEYGLGKYRQIDDYPFGGGHGMVRRADILETALLEGVALQALGVALENPEEIKKY